MGQNHNDSIRKVFGLLQNVSERKENTQLHTPALEKPLDELTRPSNQGSEVNAEVWVDHATAETNLDNGWTALHSATERGHLALVEYLCDRGANVNLPITDSATAGSSMSAYYKGGSALHIAAAKGYAGICEYLCAHGANVNVRNEVDSTPLLVCGALAPPQQMGDVRKAIFTLLRFGANLEVINQVCRLTEMKPVLTTFKEGHTVFDIFHHLFQGPSFFELMEDIAARYPEALPEASLEGDGLSISQWELIVKRIPIKTGKLFLLGDGGVGKTTLRKALQRVRDPDDPLEHEDDPENEAKRTLGIEFDYCSWKEGTEEVPISIQDHGGQRSFHLVHNMFLDSAHAIYVIVARIDRCGIDGLVEQLRYWLRFVCSTSISVGCLGIVLSGWQEGGDYVRPTFTARSVVEEFRAHLDLSSIRLLDNWLHLIDCRKSAAASMTQLRKCFVRGFLALQKDYPRQMPCVCDNLRQLIQRKRAEAGTTSTCLFPRIGQLLQDFKATSPEMECVSEPLFEKFCEHLQRCGELLLLPESLVVLAPNTLTKEIIGKLFRPNAWSHGAGSEHIHALTLGDIERITGASEWFQDIATMPLLLEHLGLCVRYPPSYATRDLVYFPAFVQTPLAPSEYPPASNKIRMRCQVIHPRYRTLYPGFFPRLFARLYHVLASPIDQFESETFSAPVLRLDAIILHREGIDCTGDMLTPFDQWLWVQVDADLQGFDVMCVWEPAFPYRSAMYTETAKSLNRAASTIDSFIKETCNQHFHIRVELSCSNLDSSDHPELSQQYHTESFGTAALMVHNIVDILSQGTIAPALQANQMSIVSQEPHFSDLDSESTVDDYDEQLFEEELASARDQLQLKTRARRG